MSRAVLISIRPKWVDLIASGKKTIEVRKTKPSALLPLKCYIYCTKPSFPHEDFIFTEEAGISGFYGGGKVIGEFICDETKRIDIPFPAYWPELDKSVLDGTCLSLTQAHDYLGHRSGYGWHISDLKIYDKPITVTDFWKPDKCPYVSDDGCTYPYHCFRAGETKRCGVPIERPPMSWCYVEDLK